MTKNSPRVYQNELLDQAKLGNSIIYLGTGSGKTYIAAMMIKEYQDELLHGVKKTVFVVNSNPLIEQQKEFIARHVSLKVESFCGADGIDFWSKADWRDKIEVNQVLVMMHDVFLRALDLDFFRLTEVNLLIVDECHHAVGNSSYVQIFHHYARLFRENLTAAPRVLGLSASIVASKCDIFKFQKLKKQLEEKMHSKVITTENLQEVLLYATQPEESFIIYHEDPVCGEIGSHFQDGVSCLEKKLQKNINKLRGERLDERTLDQCVNDLTKQMKKFRKVLTRLETSMRSLGIYCTKEIIESSSETFQKEIDESKSNFTEDCARIVTETFKKIQDEVSRILDSANMLNKCEYFSSQKVKVLLRLVREHLEKSHESRVIVFVKERQTASALAFILQQANIKHVRANYLVGQSIFSPVLDPASHLFRKVGDCREKLSKILKDFAVGNLNVLVATSVLEEGIDIQKCNLVIRFDDIENFRSYVQSKGRARAKPSEYIMMVPEERLEEKKRVIEEFREIERMSVEECHPFVDDDEDQGDLGLDPYYADPNNLDGPRITQYKAIGTVYEYIQSLPCDRFTTLVPYWEEIRWPTNNQLQVFCSLGISPIPAVKHRFHLHLPRPSGFADPVIGPLCDNRKKARVAAALEACKLLHQNKILDDHLVLVKKKRNFEDSDDEETADSKKPKIGTKRSRAYYKIGLPPELFYHAEKNVHFIYKIDLRLIESSSYLEEVKRYNVYHPEHCGHKLALVVSQELPADALKSFTLFPAFGSVEAQLILVGQVSDLIGDVLDAVVTFQTRVIPEVLKCLMPWTRADEDSSECFITVVNSSGQIDIELLRQMSEPPKPPPSPFKFRADDYVGAVVQPIHKETTERFVVEEIVTSRTPCSRLPNNAKVTFKSFYKEMHGATITQDDQPLLRISNADKQYFMFRPNNDHTTLGQVKKSREEFLDQRTLFVPELVRIFAVPVSIWREIQILPWVMQRVSSFISIGKFRQGLLNDWNLDCLSDEPSPPSENLHHHLVSETSGRRGTFPSSIELLEPLTCKGAGEEKDLERLELLGDSFLKMSVSLSVFLNKTIVNSDEGYLTQIRSRFIGNKKLFRLSQAKSLAQLLNYRKFEPMLNWAVPRTTDGLEEVLCKWDEEFREQFFVGGNDENSKEKLPSCTLFNLITFEEAIDIASRQDAMSKDLIFKNAQKRLADKDFVQQNVRLSPRRHCLISDKSIADAVEALIGLFLLKFGQAPALEFMRVYGLDISPDLNLKEGIRATDESSSSSVDWYTAKTFFPNDAINCDTSKDVWSRVSNLLDNVNVNTIENTLGYKFQSVTFLLQALSHASFIANRVTNSYERLEFLGDSIIDYLVTCFLYTSDSKMSPGEMSTYRSALVNNNMLASVCVSNGLHKHLLHSSPNLLKAIDKFVENVELEKMEESEVEALFMTADHLLQNLEFHNEKEIPELELIEVPKVLGDLVEALIGAVYLDSKGDLQRTWLVFRKIFPNMADVVDKKPRSFVVLIYELFPEQVKFSKSTTSNDGIVRRTVEVGGSKYRGIGRNGKLAKEAAAKCAIRELRKQGKV